MIEQNCESLPEALITVVDSTLTALSGGADSVRAGESEKMSKSRTGIAAEVAETLKGIQSCRDLQTWKLADGSIGSIADGNSVAELLTCLETRVAAYTGAISGSPGIGDQLKILGMLLPRWADDLISRGNGVLRGLSFVQAELGSRSTELQVVQRKLRRILEMNENMRARVETIREIFNTRQAELRPAEKMHAEKLRERRKGVIMLRRRLEELSAATRARTNEDRARRRNSEAAGRTGRGGAIGRLSMSPLAARRGSMDRSAVEIPGNDMTWTRLQRIKETLAQHTAGINMATERTAALWQQFGSM
jgi:hypothetical protein